MNGFLQPGRLPAVAGILALLAAPAVLAQSVIPAPQGTGRLPEAPTAPGAATGSETGRGVIQPPTGLDPGLSRSPPPSSEFPTRVIPPPGTSGGDSRTQAR